MQRAMARQAEAEREFIASEKLAKAASVIAQEPSAMTLRYLQTATEITSEKNSNASPPPMGLYRTSAVSADTCCGSRVLMDQGRSLSEKMVQNRVRWAARRASLAQQGVHILRHTFCSHLSMRGAPVEAIQELAGHANLGTTQRYMHLSPAAIESAIKLLDQPVSDLVRGDIGETRQVTW